MHDPRSMTIMEIPLTVRVKRAWWLRWLGTKKIPNPALPAPGSVIVMRDVNTIVMRADDAALLRLVMPGGIGLKEHDIGN